MDFKNACVFNLNRENSFFIFESLVINLGWLVENQFPGANRKIDSDIVKKGFRKSFSVGKRDSVDIEGESEKQLFFKINGHLIVDFKAKIWQILIVTLEQNLSVTTDNLITHWGRVIILDISSKTF